MITEKLKQVQDEILDTDIQGCITGSSLIDANFDMWDVTPDIDVFTYSPYAFVHAIDVIEYKLGYQPGGDAITTDAGERWKASKARLSGRGTGDLVTCKFRKDGIVINVSNRKMQRSAMDVITNFDMSIVLQAIDIPSGTLIDFREAKAKNDVAKIIGTRGGSTEVAVPNPFRSFDGTTWNAKKWLRQWDRVIKYANRGYDTLPMAKFYKHMIREITEGGCLFKTEKSKQNYEEFVKEFSELEVKIDVWIGEHE